LPARKKNVWALPATGSGKKGWRWGVFGRRGRGIPRGGVPEGTLRQRERKKAYFPCHRWDSTREGPASGGQKRTVPACLNSSEKQDDP